MTQIPKEEQEAAVRAIVKDLKKEIKKQEAQTHFRSVEAIAAARKKKLAPPKKRK